MIWAIQNDTSESDSDEGVVLYDYLSTKSESLNYTPLKRSDSLSVLSGESKGHIQRHSLQLMRKNLFNFQLYEDMNPLFVLYFWEVNFKIYLF